ncbi:membrane protein [Agaricicola taiwanensis]|uniref:Membrane protein n=1 Tax=Agaricicola taiwanensis TaxID=591372 RepID=A0A8J2VRV8_9RHOB|nr:tripartite tricarboxylate transporter TctB family protein [Agaricicola taiwanensis]GGE36659.1 membrane protein [Agaricicola taiwanensis]
MHIRNHRDVAAGILYLVLGTAFAIGALNYPLGSVSRLGPGLFPLSLGVLLTICGLAVFAGAFRSSADEERLDRWHLRPFVFVLVGGALFGLLLPYAGLVITIMVLVIVASLADREMTPAVIAATAVALAAASYLIFIYAIGLVLPVWPTVFSG